MMPLLLATAIPHSIPAWLQGVVPAGLLMLLDAAGRALLVACIVGVGLRLLAALHVPVQKAAWGLVLGGALLMPMLAPWAGHARWVPSKATWVVAIPAWSQSVLSRVSDRSPAKPESCYRQAADGTSGGSGSGSGSGSGHSVSVPLSAISVDHVEVSLPLLPRADRFPAPTVSHAQSPGADSARAFRTTYYLPFPDAVWIIYGAVCLALLLRLFYGLGGAIGLWQSAEPADVDAHLAHGLRLRFSRKICSPVTVGSAVVLPADYDDWDMQKLRIVLAHERSHVRQGDFYLQALAGLYAAVFWFSPLGWWLRRKLSDLSEAISDHAGLEEAPSRASYAQILLEFAALPRPTQVGVAMARTGRISQRIEGLLSENSFRLAFTGGRRRVWAALVLVPLALFAAAALIRVQAAQTLQQPMTEQGPVIAQSQPASAPNSAPTPAAPITAPVTAPAPQPAQEDQDGVQAPATPAAPGAVAPAPPPPDSEGNADQEVTTSTTEKCNGRSTTTFASNHSSVRSGTRHGYSYAYSSNGDSYALVSSRDKDQVSFSGDWFDGRRAELDKARTMAHGDFLWFTRNGKSYVVDDPQIVASLQAMYKPMEDLGRKQEELGRQQSVLGKQQSDLGRRQSEARVPTPDISHEMAELNAAMARLQAKMGSSIPVDQLADLQSKIGELQGKLGGLHGKMAEQQGELGRQQGHLGEQQGKLGEQQGRLGEEQGRLAREADKKVKSIIDESLKNGKARPVN